MGYTLSAKMNNRLNYWHESDQITVIPRHAGHHHTVNIKYGYFVLVISILHILSISLRKWIYFKNWGATGKSRSPWRLLTQIPICIAVVGWATIFAVIGVYNIEHLSENYVTAVKRFGRLAYASLPFLIFLVLRPANIAGFQIGYYLEVLNLHKWISRLVALASVLHGVGFFYKWTVEGVLLSKLRIFDNFLGVIVFVLSIVLVIVSVRYLRRKNYQVFYVIHNATAWSFVFLISFHARPGVTAIAILNVLLLMYQLYERFLICYSVQDISIVENIPHSSLQIIRVARPVTFPAYLAGSHIRLGYPATNISAWLLPTHPFTLASVNDENDTTLDLIVKKPTNFPIDITTSYNLTGPFPSLPPQFFNTAKQVSIVCGGSGISFGLPIFKYFSGNNRSIPIRLIWCVRSQEDMFILDHLLPNCPDNVHIYVTGVGNGSSSQQATTTLFDEEADGLLSGEGTDIELSDLQGSKERGEKKGSFSVNLGRPVLDEVLADVVANEESLDERWLISCGPRGLISHCKDWSSGKDFQFFSELYEM
ncbi:ferric reductase [Scheffersomyces xylosifermentans]|uniref:ferric reductase n=1 Tax=Scheffersomyces xylosifermentans TaxID=1304137 RepID=UPI00315D3FAA